MKGLIIPIILQLLGVVVIIAEFILPSGGVLSIAAFCLIAYSLYHVFTYVTPMSGMAFVVADIIMIPIVLVIGLKLLAKSPVTLRTSLSRSDGVQSQDSEFEHYFNKEGTAVTDLRPAGKATIEGNRIDVVTRGDYIEKGSPIFVVTVEGNQVIVRTKEI